jgi:dUTP pyrophosphatase
MHNIRIKFLLFFTGDREDENFVIKDGDRICQMIIAKHEKAEWINVGELKKTNRAEGGFEHTGKK